MTFFNSCELNGIEILRHSVRFHSVQLYVNQLNSTQNVGHQNFVYARRFFIWKCYYHAHAAEKTREAGQAANAARAGEIPVRIKRASLLPPSAITSPFAVLLALDFISGYSPCWRTCFVHNYYFALHLILTLKDMYIWLKTYLWSAVQNKRNVLYVRA